MLRRHQRPVASIYLAILSRKAFSKGFQHDGGRTRWFGPIWDQVAYKAKRPSRIPSMAGAETDIHFSVLAFCFIAGVPVIAFRPQKTGKEKFISRPQRDADYSFSIPGRFALSKIAHTSLDYRHDSSPHPSYDRILP